MCEIESKFAPGLPAGWLCAPSFSPPASVTICTKPFTYLSISLHVLKSFVQRTKQCHFSVHPLNPFFLQENLPTGRSSPNRGATAPIAFVAVGPRRAYQVSKRAHRAGRRTLRSNPRTRPVKRRARLWGRKIRSKLRRSGRKVGPKVRRAAERPYPRQHPSPRRPRGWGAKGIAWA